MGKIMYKGQSYAGGINTGGSGGGGGTSTAIPTASTTAKFDTAAHMNSEDMTSQEVSNFVDSLDAQGESLDELLNTFESITYGTLSLYNCTGTISHNQLAFLKSKGGEIWVQGRVNIDSFVKTGANPGVNITLPSLVSTPTKTRELYIGFRAQEPREMVVLTMTEGSRTVILKTTESFVGASNGALTFICSGRIYVN